MQPPVFYYDFSSPYSYLAAWRVDGVLPVRPQWRPIAFGVIVRRVGKVPWSFAKDRREHLDEIARRATARGLPTVRYPDGWPVETYSLAPLRAAVVAAEDGQERLRTLSRELFKTMFVDGRHLVDAGAVLDAVERAGMDRSAVQARIEDQTVKDRLRAQTDEALARGITGVPTVALDEQLFWGDDRLEEAAQALTASLP